ncbi:hypothetical protein RB195_023134 [Necator americanus]|uniref:Uncharacterized protein n=1 Tax=Necator americanus TaxID=51031 RepID=A0ABR1EIL9_NECAM
MGPPVTRSRTLSSDVRAIAPMSSLDARALAPMHGSFMTNANGQPVRALQELNGDANVHGSDGKTLRDETALAITEVWSDARSATCTLTKKADEGASTSLHNLNESVSAVGSRIDAIPFVATYSLEGPILVPFSGSGDDATQFPLWFRWLEDVMQLPRSNKE